jgi:uncharacterized protein (TIGR04141 family)
VLSLERRSELEFIDRIRPVQDEEILIELDQRLEEMLGAPLEAVEHDLSCVVPMELAGESESLHAHKVRLGIGVRTVREMSLADLLNRAHILREGSRLEGLREGKVQSFSDEGGTELVAGTRAIEWLEAVVSLDPRNFAIVDGDWYEIDAGYRDRLRELVQALLDVKSDLELPKWRRGRTEREFNESAAVGSPLICLDRKRRQGRVRSPLGIRGLRSTRSGQ